MSLMNKEYPRKVWGQTRTQEMQSLYSFCTQETQYIGDTKPTMTDLQYTKITLTGLEYLEENSLMQKATRLPKGIVE